ncbi:hypothetical protein BDZ94DRAFT_1300250 [Collybia nuda]|uniref:Acetoin reductase family protein n=1 Tax=Collybia nuda TaxID=64659 RepID=A0A9P5XZY0_9AGAR|nr:hypothetical protein BDZ94DRAFT_1300250 [Collybia nuda]
MTSIGVAFVTGASQGLGRAIALRLARDGFDVAVNDIQKSRDKLESLRQEITAKGRKSSVQVGDASSKNDVESMIASVVADMGELNVMVANAGICITKPMQETSDSEWDRVLATNARSAFLCYKYAGKQMISQGRGGRIIGASSVAGKQGEAYLTAYSASKFAVRGLTQAAAREYGPHGITVNAYSPGTIDTQMLIELGDAVGGAEAFYKEQAEKTSLGRNGEAPDIASIVSYLASKEAGYITGQSISVNGGRYFD